MPQEQTKKKLYIEANEEITSIVGRIKLTKASDIILVLPRGANILQSITNLKLLKKEADKLGKNISIATADKLGRNLVEKAEMEAREESAPFREIKKPPQQMFDIVPAPTEPVSSKEKVREKIQTKISKFRETLQGREFRRKSILKVVNLLRNLLLKRKKIPKSRPILHSLLPTFSIRFLSLFIGVSCFVGLVVVFLLLPNAEIEVVPKGKEAEINLEIVIDKRISETDPFLNKIPGQMIKIEREKSRQFFATQEKEFREKARGIITVYNKLTYNQALVERTRFLSSEGKLFRTTRYIIVPAATISEGGGIIPGVFDVEVVADKPGEEYNIRPSHFTIPAFKEYLAMEKYNNIYGESRTAMTGGITAKAKIVSKDDIQKGESILQEELKEEIKKELESRIPSDLKLIDDTLQCSLLESSSSVEEGAQAEKFVVSIKMTARALLFKEEHLDEIIRRNLILEISPEFEIKEEPFEVAYSSSQYGPKEEELKVEVYAKAQVFWKIDLEELKQDLRGKNEEEVREYLSLLPEIKSAKVSFWPFWVKRIPTEDRKIRIKLGVD